MPEISRRRNFEDDFKRKAVSYYLENKVSLAAAASNFGITAGMLYKWLQRFSPGSPAVKGNDQSQDRQLEKVYEEIQNLKNEVGELRRIMGKTILTKYFEE